MTDLQGYGVFLRVMLIILCSLGSWVQARPGMAQEWSHGAIHWQNLGRGLQFAQVEVLLDDTARESLAVVRVDPNYNAFRVYHGPARPITEWQETTGALVVFNASYYTPRGEPCGLVLSDGKPLGPRRNAAMRGMFVSEPRGVSPDLPRATILDLTNSPINLKNLPWTQGVQSFPLLLDSKGRIRVKSTSQMAQRTVIATDRVGNILILNSARDTFTLYDLAKFLKASNLDIDAALNLDGGSKAQMLIKTPDFTFASPSFFEQRARELFDSQTLLLPTVVGVFPRSE